MAKLKTTVLPAATYHPGTSTTPTLTVAAGLTAVVIAFDKTLGWTDPGVTLEVTLDLSLDGGATWNTPAADVVPFPVAFGAEGGGLDKFGVPYTEATLSTSLPHPELANRRLRAVVTVAGGDLTTSAAITVSDAEGFA
jgi:hypothetical protein